MLTHYMNYSYIHEYCEYEYACEGLGSQRTADYTCQSAKIDFLQLSSRTTYNTI